MGVLHILASHSVRKPRRTACAFSNVFATWSPETVPAWSGLIHLNFCQDYDDADADLFRCGRDSGARSEGGDYLD